MLPSTGAIKALSPLVSALIEVVLKDAIVIFFWPPHRFLPCGLSCWPRRRAGWTQGRLYGELAADILEGKRKFYTLIQFASDVKVKDRKPVAIQYANNTTTSPVSKFLSEYVLL